MSFPPIGISERARTGPASMASTMRMTVTPVTVWPRATAQLTGAAPRSAGRREACTFSDPRRGASRSSRVRMCP